MSLIFMYIEKMIGYMLLSLPFYIIGRIIFVKRRQSRIIAIKEVGLSIFFLYILGLVSQTIMPRLDMGVYYNTGEFYFDISLTNEISKVNFIPFYTIYQYLFSTNADLSSWTSVSHLNILANLLLFLPLGLFIPLLWKKQDSLKKIMVLGLIITCSIEFIQYFIGRSSDIDDVLLNTLGIASGYLFLSLAKRANFSPLKP